jgi:hypothetical protein
MISRGAGRGAGQGPRWFFRRCPGNEAQQTELPLLRVNCVSGIV